MSVVLLTVTYCEERNMAKHRPGLQGNFQSIFFNRKKGLSDIYHVQVPE